MDYLLCRGIWMMDAQYHDYWIIDGNYRGSLDIRIHKVNTIILLNYTTLSCIYRVLKRIIINYGKSSIGYDRKLSGAILLGVFALCIDV